MGSKNFNINLTALRLAYSTLQGLVFGVLGLLDSKPLQLYVCCQLGSG